MKFRMRKIYLWLLIVLCCMNVDVKTFAAQREDICEKVVAVTEQVHRVGATKEYKNSNGLTLEEYLLQEIEKRTTKIDLEDFNIPASDIGVLYRVINYGHPELFYIRSTVAYKTSTQAVYIIMEYADYTPEEIAALHKKLDEPLTLLPDGMTDVEKILFIHNYICDNVVYATGDTTLAKYHSIEGILTEGNAVCEGYAKLFKYYMLKLGIPCKLIGDVRHVWNEVQVGGKWYMVDTTHDDPSTLRHGELSYDHFMKSYSMMSDQAIDTTLYDGYEPCTSTKYNKAFWNNTNTSMVYRDGKWYYIKTSDKNNMNLYCHDYGNDSLNSLGRVIVELEEKWYTSPAATSFWPGSYGKVGTYNNKLIYTTPMAIYQCDFDGNNKKCIEMVDISKGFIFGFKIVGNQAIYQLTDSLNKNKFTEVKFLLTRSTSQIVKKNTTVKDAKSGATYVVTKTGSTRTVTYKANMRSNYYTVTIPSKVYINGQSYKVTAIGKQAFKNNKYVMKVTIPSSVSSIGYEAFRGCQNLTSITIPSKVNTIGKKAFYKCSKLSKITIKTKKLTKKRVGGNAFKGINQGAIIKVPKSKLSSYRKILRARGAGKTVRIKR